MSDGCISPNSLSVQRFIFPVCIFNWYTSEADCAVEGLFPGSGLEVLLSRDLDGQAPSLPPLPVKVELDAMRAIGEAITKEMQASGTKLLTLNVQGCGEIVVFKPEMRETVLLGTRTTLLGA